MEAEEAEDVPVWAAKMAEDIRHLRETLDRYSPVIEAYLDPLASGPVAWAVRRKTRKGADDG